MCVGIYEHIVQLNCEVCRARDFKCVRCHGSHVGLRVLEQDLTSVHDRGCTLGELEESVTTLLRKDGCLSMADHRACSC